MRLHIPTDVTLRMQLEILLLYALVWTSLAVFCPSTAEYPLEACWLPLGDVLRNNAGVFIRVLLLDYKEFSKCYCRLDHSATLYSELVRTSLV